MLLPLLRTEKMTSDYDRLADVYDGNFRTALDLAEDAGVRRQIVRAGAIMGGERILDIGCGTGLLLDWYPHLVHRYTGVDVSRKMLNVLERKHRKASVINADIMFCKTAWPFGAAVCTNGAVTYAGSPAAVAKKLKDLVKPGGRVVYSTCSLLNEENEDVVRASGGEIDDLTARFPGMASPDLSGALRLLPHVNGTDGFFVARLVGR
jgi:predicted TPR repeat methyltransferase